MKNRKLSDGEIEQLLSGSATPSHLTGLTNILAMLREDGTRVPPSDTVARFAAKAAEITPSAVLRSGAVPPAKLPQTNLPQTKEPRMGIRRKLVAIPAAVGLMLASMTGVALAADGAAPGDTLYGIDLALERVGVGAGGAAERIDEVAALTAQNRTAEALQHATTAVAEVEADENSEEALLALESAIAELSAIEEGSDHAKEVRTNVAAMLQWMIDNADLANDPTQPGAFGRGIASMAGAISDEDNEEDAAEAAADAAEDAADAAKDAAETAADAAEREAEGDAGSRPAGVRTGPPVGIPPTHP